MRRHGLRADAPCASQVTREVVKEAGLASDLSPDELTKRIERRLRYYWDGLAQEKKAQGPTPPLPLLPAPATDPHPPRRASMRRSRSRRRRLRLCRGRRTVPFPRSGSRVRCG